MKQVIKISILLCLCGGLHVLQAQSAVREPAEITRMIEAFQAKFKSQETVKAWKIQIAASSDRREIERQKARFERLFPYYNLDWVHDNPYYILKMKDLAFARKIDALHLLHEIKNRHSFPAILILEDIERHKLLSSNNP